MLMLTNVSMPTKLDYNLTFSVLFVLPRSHTHRYISSIYSPPVLEASDQSNEIFRISETAESCLKTFSTKLDHTFTDDKSIPLNTEQIRLCISVRSMITRPQTASHSSTVRV